MKVYIVFGFWGDNDDPSVLGVFANREIADQLAKKERATVEEWDVPLDLV